MIGRSDGGFAGGVLPLTDEMQQHGARPAWLGYIYVEDVDAAVAAIEQAGGKTLMPPPTFRMSAAIAMVTDPQGAPFYIMKPMPPADNPEAKSDVFSPTSRQRVGWNELQTSDPTAARRLLRRPVRLGERRVHGYGRDGRLSLLRPQRQRDRRAVADACRRQPAALALYFRVPSIAAAKETAEDNGGTIPWARTKSRPATGSSSAPTRRARIRARRRRIS